MSSLEQGHLSIRLAVVQDKQPGRPRVPWTRRRQDPRDAAALMSAPARNPAWFRAGLDSQPVQPAMVPGGKQLSGLFLMTRVSTSVTGLPLTAKMPPPWAAVLPVTRLNFRVSGLPGPSVPSLLMVASKIPPPGPDAVLPRTCPRSQFAIMPRASRGRLDEMFHNC